MEKKNLHLLSIGINYKNTNMELQNCIYDALDMEKQLSNLFNVKKNVLLTDDTEIKPTKENILQSIQELAENANANENYWIHYSGHGVQQRNQANDDQEKDGKDEAIVPLDYDGERSKLILDDELNEVCQLFPENTNVFMTFDCCHSGTMMDLPFKYRKQMDNRNHHLNRSITQPVHQERFWFLNVSQNWLFQPSLYNTYPFWNYQGWHKFYQPSHSTPQPQLQPQPKPEQPTQEQENTNQEKPKEQKKNTNSFVQEKLNHIRPKVKCRLICFSGGLDSQTVSDGMHLKNGLFTESFLKQLEKHTLQDLRVHDLLKESIEFVEGNSHHEQFTQVHSSFEHPINMKLTEFFH